MKNLLRVSIIVPVMSLVIGIATPSMATLMTWNETASGGYILGTSPSSDLRAGLTLGFDATTTYNLDFPDPTVSADTVTVPQGATGFAVYPKFHFQPVTLTSNTNYNFDTDLWAGWNGVKITIPIVDKTITIIPGFNESFSIPNFSYDNVSFTTEGDGTLSSSSSIDPNVVGCNYTELSSFDAESDGSLWQVQGDAVSMLADLSIPVVSDAAAALDDIGFYVDPGIGLGVDARTTWSLDGLKNFGSLSTWPSYECSPPMSDSIFEPVTDSTPGLHKYTYSGYTYAFGEIETKYNGYGNASVSLGDSYISSWNHTWNWDLGTAGPLCTYWGDEPGFPAIVFPVTFTGTYDVVAAPAPEPATLLLLGAGLIGLAGFSRKKLFKKS